MLSSNNWSGMILHLYRQIDSSVYPAARLKNEIGGGGKTYTAFGNFDRLCFTPVPRFIDYLKRSGSAYQWIGGRKDIMLYPIDDPASPDRHFSFTEKGDVGEQSTIVMQIKSVETSRRFLAVTMLYLSDKAKAMVKSYHSLLEKCKDQISNIANVYNDLCEFKPENGIIFDVFGAFNSAEIVVLWGADQFTDIQYIVDQIRYLALEFEGEPCNVALFASSYTIVTFYDNKYSDFGADPVKGGAMIQLALGTARDPKIVPDKKASVEYLEKLGLTVKAKNPKSVFEIDSCAGEYDFIIETCPPQLELLSKISPTAYGGLCTKNPNFSTHFSNSTTRLFYHESKDIKKVVTDYNWETILKVKITREEENLELPKLWQDDRKLVFLSSEYKSYRNKLLKSVTDVSSLCTTVELLYGDYIRAVNTTPDRQWAEDLNLQVNTALDILGRFCAPDDVDKIYIDRDYVESAESVLKRLQQQIQHVTETGKFSFEEPCSHAESTTEYDLLFHMYYGAVKDILSCMYDRTEGSSQAKQSKLIPLIHFEPTPIIKSTLYYDLEGVQDRLVDLTIPYDAWGEPNLYILYLIHELYHYAAPFNRNDRNELFAKFLVVELATNAIQILLKRYYEDALPERGENETCKKCKKCNKCEACKEYENQTDCEEVKERERYEREIRAIGELKKLGRNDFDGAMSRITSAFKEKIWSQVASKNVTDYITRSAKYFDKSDPGYNMDIAMIDMINRGDAPWSTFNYALERWYCGIDGYAEANDDNYLRFIIPAINEAMSQISSKSVSGDIYSKERMADKVVLDAFEILICKAGTSSKDFVFVDAIRNVSDYWMEQIHIQLRELFPDYAMVKLSGITASEYLFVFAVWQEKLYTSPDFITQTDESLPLRMGYIIDNLVGCNDHKAETKMAAFEEAVKDDFVRLYTSYTSLCSWTDGGTSQEKNDHKVVTTQMAEDWFEAFKCRLGSFYSQYGVYKNLLDEIAIKSFKPICCSKNNRRLQDCTSTFFASLRENNAKMLFNSNLTSIWEFQQQIFLSALTIKAEKIPVRSKVQADVYHLLLNNRRTDILRKVNNPNDLLKELASISQNLEDIHCNVFGSQLPQNGLWYRGSQNSDYDILPSIMVHFLDDANLKVSNAEQGKNRDGNLWQYQRSLLERFKYQADGAAEFLNGTAYTMPDYLAIMQHYQKYTCYLDWSEDAFSSLFFALEKYIMDEIDETYKNSLANVSLYILDPMLYNRARKIMVQEHLPKWPRLYFLNESDIWIAEQNTALANEADGYIPNLSAKYYPEKFGMFTIDLPRNTLLEKNGVHAYHRCKCSAKDATLDDIPQELSNLPLAVHTSRLNPRIRTQSGQFIAYSPFALPAYGSKEKDEYYDGKKMRADRYSYMSLMKIQKYFLKEYTSEYPFMYELQIDYRCKKDIADFLRKSGISRYRIYPELTHLKL